MDVRTLALGKQQVGRGVRDTVLRSARRRYPRCPGLWNSRLAILQVRCVRCIPPREHPARTVGKNRTGPTNCHLLENGLEAISVCGPVHLTQNPRSTRPGLIDARTRKIRLHALAE